jgi:hypothetical protein
MLWALKFASRSFLCSALQTRCHSGRGWLASSGAEAAGSLLAVQAGLQRDQRARRAPNRVGRKLERLAGGWGP